MIHRTLPYFLEDRTGTYSASDFDDIYDRMFLRVSPPHASSQDSTEALMVYDTGRRSSSQKDYRPSHYKPLVTMDFGPHGSLGNIIFDGWPSSMPMNQYLKKTSLFRGSLSRKFKACDGQEYKWSYRTVSEQEWSCTDSQNRLVAHYNPRHPDKPVFSTSGNVLTIYEAFSHLAVDILASLTIMRHIAVHNL